MSWGRSHPWEGRTVVTDELERVADEYRYEERARGLSWFGAGFVVSTCLWCAAALVLS